MAVKAMVRRAVAETLHSHHADVMPRLFHMTTGR